MFQHLAQIVADIALFTFVLFLPAAWLLYSVRNPGGLQPADYIPFFAVAGLAGVLLQFAALAVVAAIVLLAFGLTALGARWSVQHVTYSRAFSPSRLFPGETVDLTLRVHNNKLLPLAWCAITDPVWVGALYGNTPLDRLLRFSEGIERAEGSEYALVTEAAVGPFGRLERRIQITGLRRGVYTIGPAEMVTGDPFGLYGLRTRVGTRQDIVVYPQIHTQEELGFSFREALGPLVSRRTLLEDPTLIAGSREYRPGDPLRRIHWRATARQGELQVRVADPSTTAQVMLVLNLTSVKNVWEGLGSDRFEAAIRVAASLVVWALDRGFAVGLHSNGIVGGAEANTESPRVAPSADPRQAPLLLEHLARLTFVGRFSPEWVLYDEARRLRASTTIVLVTPIVTAPMIRVLSAPDLLGRVSVVYCGRSAAPLIPGVPVHLATLAAERIHAAG